MSDDVKVSYVACDYAFMGEKEQDDQMSNKCLRVLVHKFYRDRWVTSHVVPRKGADQWASKMVSHDLKLSGLQSFGGGEEAAREAGQYRGEHGGERRWRECF